MAGTLNKVMLIGFVGGVVKTHFFEGGGCVARFSIATHETYTNKTTQEKTTQTEWHNIVVKNKLAEICEKFLNKGDKVYCEGKIKTREWTLEGVKKIASEIHVTEINFLTPKSTNTQDPLPPEKITGENIIDDLPF